MAFPNVRSTVRISHEAQRSNVGWKCGLVCAYPLELYLSFSVLGIVILINQLQNGLAHLLAVHCWLKHLGYLFAKSYKGQILYFADGLQE
jgi:hypothetical protein